jgi:hypothetical protein
LSVFYNDTRIDSRSPEQDHSILALDSPSKQVIKYCQMPTWCTCKVACKHVLNLQYDVAFDYIQSPDSKVTLFSGSQVSEPCNLDEIICGSCVRIGPHGRTVEKRRVSFDTPVAMSLPLGLSPQVRIIDSQLEGYFNIKFFRDPNIRSYKGIYQ